MQNHPDQQNYSNLYKDDLSAEIIAKGVKALRSRLSEIPFSRNKKVLDVACGISTLGKTFSGRVWGLDLNPEAIKIARKNGIKAKVGDVEKRWNFPNDYFDIVIASHIIEHVLNPDKLILEVKRVLRKGGLLIVWTPNLAAWFNRILLLFGFQPFYTEVSTVDKTTGLKFLRKFNPMRSPIGHLRIFTAGALKDILELHGLQISKIAGVEFLAFPPILLFFDKIIARNPSLCSTIVMVAKKT